MSVRTSPKRTKDIPPCRVSRRSNGQGHRTNGHLRLCHTGQPSPKTHVLDIGPGGNGSHVRIESGGIQMRGQSRAVVAPRHRAAPWQPPGRHRADRPVPGQVRTGPVVALIPAHNEEANIAAAVEGLLTQTCRPDRVVVVADNCTDQTARIAVERGAEVVTTSGNTHKKAGALNQALDHVLPTLGDDAYVLVTDADSVLVPG